MHVHEGRSNGLINVNVFDIGHKPTPDRGTPPSFAKRARRASIAVVAVLVVVFVLVVVLFFFFFCLPLLFFLPMMLRGSERVNEIGNGVVRDRNVNLNPHTASALKFEILIFERSLPCTAPCPVPGMALVHFELIFKKILLKKDDIYYRHNIVHRCYKK